MWNRQAVKERGKSNFRNNYGRSVLTALLYNLFFIGTGAATASQSGTFSQDMSEDPDFVIVALAIFAILGVFLLIWTLIDIFLINPLEVGCQRFFVVNQHQPATFSELTCAYKNNYGSTVVGIFLRDFLIGLGSLLFVIPGLILSYSYRMVPYILADDPSVSGVQALKISREMMNGNKWRCFVYDMSFFLWYILTAFIFLVGIFYVNPYKYNADAALYEEIRDEYQKSRTV